MSNFGKVASLGADPEDPLLLPVSTVQRTGDTGGPRSGAAEGNTAARIAANQERKVVCE